ncbi:MAG: proton-conducting transporter membrane subunit, partial [Acidilobaceae archaeon]
LLLASVVLAFGLSAGLFPLHFWMPDLYERISTPVAILLAGGKEVVAVYVVARMLYTVHSSHPYAGEALATVKVALFALGLGGVVYGALAILARQSFRRMLAYYLVMDAGIIFVVLSAGGPRAIEAFVYLALSHVVLSIALFSLCDILESPQAIGRPLLATAGALVAAGAPPFSSFFGKLLALLALLDKPASLALFAASVVVSSLAPLIAILRASSEQRDSARMWVLAQLLLASLSVVASLALGIGVFWLRELVLEPVAIEAIDYQSYIEPALERAREIYDRYWPRD